MRKNLYLSALCLSIMLLSMAATVKAQTFAPGYITGITATAGSQQSSSRTSGNMVTNTGFVESMTGMKSGVIHMGVANDSNFGWMSDTKIPVEQNYASFDFGSVHTLDEMWVWNWNELGKGYYGMKTADVLYSDTTNDPTQMTKLGTFTFAESVGNDNVVDETPSNQQGSGLPVAFGGVPVRYVRLVPAVGNGNGNWRTSDSRVGLCKVRFYEPSAQPWVNPTAISMKTLVGTVSTTTLVIGAVGAPSHIVTMTQLSANNPSAAYVSITPALNSITLPAIYGGGDVTTLTLRFAPTVKGVYNTTVSLHMTLEGGGAMDIAVPIKTWGYEYEPTFVRDVKTSASGSSNSSRGSEKTTDNSGITEADAVYGSKGATHGIGTADFWQSGNNGPNKEYIVFDLGAPIQIGEMWVWNYNEAAPNTLYGIQNAYVSYKTNWTDGWTTLGGDTNTFQFARAAGVAGQLATNLSTGSPVLFRGTSARFVRIIGAGGVGVGNWTTGTNARIGLSEVRFYRFNPGLNPVKRWTSFE